MSMYVILYAIFMSKSLRAPSDYVHPPRQHLVIDFSLQTSAAPSDKGPKAPNT